MLVVLLPVHNSDTVQVEERGHKLSYEWPSCALCESLLLEIAAHMRQQLSPFGNLCHQAVQVVRLHCLVEPDDIRVPETPHKLSLTEKILSNIILLDFICLDYFYCNLMK